MVDVASQDASVCILAIIAFSGIKPLDPSTATTQPTEVPRLTPGDDLRPTTRPDKAISKKRHGSWRMTTVRTGDGTGVVIVLDREMGQLATYRIDTAGERLALIAARDAEITRWIAARPPGARIDPWDGMLTKVTGALDDDDPSIREHAAWALGRIGRRAVLSDMELRDATKDRDPFVRDAATWALGRVLAYPHRGWLPDAKPPSTPRRQDVRQYVINLKSSSSHERFKAALGLVYRAEKPSLAVDVLAEALDNESAEIACRAAAALAEIGPSAKAARSALNAATRHRDSFVRRAASVALEAVGSSSSELSPEHRKRLEDIFVDRKISLAIGRLTSAKPVSRVLAGRELARYGTKAVPPLREALKGGNEELVAEVICVLGRIGKPATGTLIKLLRDKETIVPAFAAAALVDIGRPAVPALIEALKDRDAIVRSIAAEILGRIGPQAAQAADALTEATKDATPDVRKEAAAALRKIRQKGK